MEDLQAITAQDEKKKEVTINVTKPSTSSTIKNQDSIKDKARVQPTRKWIMNQMRNAREVTKEGRRWSVPIGNDISLMNYENWHLCLNLKALAYETTRLRRD